MCRLSREWRIPVEDIDVSLDEMALQIAYDEHHPSMEYRLEFMIAQLTAIVCAVAGSKKKFNPSDFMLSNLMKEKEPANVDDQVRAMFGRK